MEIIKPGIPKAKHKDKLKLFRCDCCFCEWVAKRGEYKEDWSIHSIPAYCKCPNCGAEIYAVGTFQNDSSHSHIRI